MNRREFLKSLAGLGAGLVMPLPLSAHTEPDVEAAWEAVNRRPAVFSVAPWGTLSIGDEEPLDSRSEIYCIRNTWANREELARLISENWQLEALAESVVADCIDWSDDLACGPAWDDWLAGASKQDFAQLEARVRAWLDEPPDLSNEYEFLPPMNTATPESRAYSFFRMQDQEFLKSLGVVVIEGEHPGSSYFAAEFRGDLDAVNRFAQEQQIPVRFVREEA